MFRFWLQFHPLLILCVMIGVFTVSGAVIHWLQCYSRWRERLANAALGLPTFVSISTLFALFAAFLLADTMERHMTAQRAVDMEAGALLGLMVGSASMEEGGQEIRTAIRDYGRLVVDEEWPAMRKEQASASAAQALLAVMRIVSDLPPREGVSTAVHGHMLSLSQQVVDARASRLATVTTHFQSFSWTALFLLGMLTQFVLGMGFLERAASNRTVIVLFSLAAVIALWLIAIQDNPFRGPRGVSAAQMLSVLEMPDS
jgi:hypothetical protein